MKASVLVGLVLASVVGMLALVYGLRWFAL